MTPLERQFVEDRAMRDSAKALFSADVAQVRSDLANRGVGERIGARIGEGAVDMADEALEMAGDNKGVIGAALGALLLYLFRNPLIDWLFGDDEGVSDEGRDAHDDGWDEAEQY